MTYKVVIEPAEEGGYTVYVPALKGCVSEGETVEEAIENIKDAIRDNLSVLEDTSIKERQEMIDLKTLEQCGDKRSGDLSDFANLLLKLTPDEIETLEVLLDRESMTVITASLEEAEQGKGLTLSEW